MQFSYTLTHLYQGVDELFKTPLEVLHILLDSFAIHTREFIEKFTVLLIVYKYEIALVVNNQRPNA